jgi:hypothetical protein
MMIDVKQLAEQLEKDLDKRIMCPNMLLSRFRFITESSRKSGAYSDPTYAPFYYYLGKRIAPKKLFKFGFHLGILSGCFFMTCNTVQNFFAFHLKTNVFYSVKIGIKNVRSLYANTMKYHLGSPHDPEVVEALKTGWDLIIFNQECSCDDFRTYLDLVWDGLAPDGLLIVENLSRYEYADAYKDFCLSKNRKEVVVNTRYITGLIDK